ncbi:MAG: polyprenyl synthetase family protein [Candidatus Aenigmarchaeota archaeon]|nr:polyprenyl synthetase family protein [Candidatus Aenigmarchaeota archaeon]
MDRLETLARDLLPDQYLPPFLYAFAGGKLIRPRILRLVCDRLGQDPVPLEKAALAIEVLHCATLLHDDVVDGDGSRRGKPTFHARFSPKQAILSGDYFALTALDLVQRHYPTLTTAFLAAVRDVAVGQLMEFAPLPDLRSYLDYADKKTASLFALAAAVPCAVFQTDLGWIAWARDLGVAFQMANDLQGSPRESHSVLAVLSRSEAERDLAARRAQLQQKVENNDQEFIADILTPRPDSQGTAGRPAAGRPS